MIQFLLALKNKFHIEKEPMVHFLEVSKLILNADVQAGKVQIRKWVRESMSNLLTSEITKKQKKTGHCKVNLKTA